MPDAAYEYNPERPIYAPFFGVMGATSAMVFSALGAAYGTAKSGTGIAAMSVMRPELIMKSIIPVVSISVNKESTLFHPVCHTLLMTVYINLLLFHPSLSRSWPVSLLFTA